MFFYKNILSRSNIWRNLYTKEPLKHSLSSLRSLTGFPVYNKQNCWLRIKSYEYNFKKPLLLEHRKFYCKVLNQGDEEKTKSELTHITKLFPQPRVTLYELTTKTPQKIFDVHFKQIVNTPKGNRKKIVHGDWVCTYTFIWPEKMKFESTALSKRQAAEKAGTMALHWLYLNNRIDKQGCPIYDREVLDDLRSSINSPIEASISETSVDRIEKIWTDYDSGIRPLYEETFNEAAKKSIASPACFKDSSLDEEEFSDGEELDAEHDAESFEGPYIHPVYGKRITEPSPQAVKRREWLIEQQFKEYNESLTPLPIDQYADEITSTLETSRVTIIVGAAGCGKSTRTPAAILRHFGAKTNVIVSEPRRVAAVGLAQRVASELGDEVGGLIGYQVRLQSYPPRPPCGSVLYCTSGVLLRRLQTNPGLKGCSHVIIDEAHERDVNTDITLLLLKRALDINPELRVVVMSATLDVGVFTKYFQDSPVIEVPGRIFPVEVSHLDDIIRKYRLRLDNTIQNCKKEDGRYNVNCQEVAEVIKAIDTKEPEGAILVFLPGWFDIKMTKRLLDEHYGDSTTHMILPVHSRLSTTEQTKMFTKPLPGTRKIVLATNVAETSITIPDVVYVVDTGLHKENRTKEGTGTSSLETTWVSLAAAKQRAGRAGRVQAGHCYRLYTKEKEAEFAPHSTPEILRVPLDRTVLDCKTYAPEYKVKDFLSQLPEPPSKKAIEFAVNDLIDLGALTPTEHPTSLGAILSAMSLPPRLACSVVLSSVAGSALSAANVAVHCSDDADPFVARDARDENREFKRSYNETSDHAALHKIQTEFEYVRKEHGKAYSEQWCSTRGLRWDRLNYIKKISNLHLENLLKSTFLGSHPDPAELTRFSDIDELTSAVLLGGANSLLITKRRVKTKGKLATVIDINTTKGERAHIGSESVNHTITKRCNKTQLLAYYGGLHSNERRALVVYKTSVIPPQTALLFCKGDIETKMINEQNETTILFLPKHQLQILVPTSQVTTILKAREMLWNTFQYFIDRDFKTMQYDDHVTISRFKTRLIKAISKILVESHREYVSDKHSINYED